MSGQPRVLHELTRNEALLRLGSVPFGRVVFTLRALPAIRPVNHVVADGRVVFCTSEGTAIVRTGDIRRGTVLTYEADDIDPVARAGWSVIVTGLAWLVDDPRQAARYRDAVRSWIGGQMECVIAIDPGIVTGFEFCLGDHRGGDHAAARRLD
jgi:hypothetical protein